MVHEGCVNTIKEFETYDRAKRLRAIDPGRGKRVAAARLSIVIRPASSIAIIAEGAPRAGTRG